MATSDPLPLRDFPDRAIRKLLEDAQNLRDLLTAVVPDLVDRFDFNHVEVVPRTFLLDDWRRRESDLLFRIPFATQTDGDADRFALVCVLLEHQSQPDPTMPLRMLLYAVLYWEQEWRAWESNHAPGETLQLTPVLPIVFHTGGQPWRAHRELADLIQAPDPLKLYVPQWNPLFWDLAERTPEQLLNAAGEWMQALAVVRAERTEEAAFRELFTEVLRRLEGLRDRERVRWHDLVHFVLSWALRRRPSLERPSLLTAARTSQATVAHRREMRKMSETVQRTWEQEMLAEGELRARREILRELLEERFGALPPTIARRIEVTTDRDRLRRCIQQVLRIQDLAELDI